MRRTSRRRARPPSRPAQRAAPHHVPRLHPTTRTATSRPSAEYAGSDTCAVDQRRDRSGLGRWPPEADQPIVGDRDEVPAVGAERDVPRPRAVPVQRLGDRPIVPHVVQGDAATAQAEGEQPRLRRVDRQRPGPVRRESAGRPVTGPCVRSQIQTAPSLPTPTSRLPASLGHDEPSSRRSGRSRSMRETSCPVSRSWNRVRSPARPARRRPACRPGRAPRRHQERAGWRRRRPSCSLDRTRRSRRRSSSPRAARHRGGRTPRVTRPWPNGVEGPRLVSPVLVSSTCTVPSDSTASTRRPSSLTSTATMGDSPETRPTCSLVSVS